MVILSQLVLAGQAWKAQKYNIAWQKKHAAKILFYGGDEILGSPCPETKARSPICKMYPAKRDGLVGFLKDNNLNVFSESIRRKYLY